MQIPVIKKIADQYSIEELKKAEESLMEETPLEIDVDGEDEGEQLTHILAAIWVKRKWKKKELMLEKQLETIL